MRASSWEGRDAHVYSLDHLLGNYSSADLGDVWRGELTRKRPTKKQGVPRLRLAWQSVLENWWLHERWDEKRDVISHASGIHFNFASCTRETRRPIPRRFFSSGLSGNRPTCITWNASRLSSRLVLCPAACAEKGGICRLSNQPVANCSTRKSTVFVYRGNFIWISSFDPRIRGKIKFKRFLSVAGFATLLWIVIHLFVL